MAVVTLPRQIITARKSLEPLSWTKKTLVSDGTYEAVVDFENKEQDYILLVRAAGSNGAIKLTWTETEFESTVTREFIITNGDIHVLGAFGPDFGTTPIIEGKLTTVLSNTLDFALLKIR